MSLFTDPPMAPRYDGKTRDFAMGANNVLREVGWVVTAMHLGLCTRKGSWRSSPKVGTDLQNIQYLGGESMQAEVERRVREGYPISQLLAEGKAEIVSIAYEITPSGQLLVAVDFVDLTADRNRIQQITSA